MCRWRSGDPPPQAALLNSGPAPGREWCYLPVWKEPLGEAWDCLSAETHLVLPLHSDRVLFKF